MKKVFAVVVVAVAASIPSTTARSAFPGGNGRIAFTSEQSGSYEIDVMNADGSGRTMLAARAMEPAWSPDGSKIAFATERDGNFQIYVMNADGSGPRGLRRTTASTHGLRGRRTARRSSFRRFGTVAPVRSTS
jgi:Tol biopolymer transport system component